MQFKTNQRIFVCGRTGSGKTYLVLRYFFMPLNKVLIHDRKHEIWLGNTFAHTPEEVVTLWNQRRNRIIYQPYDPSVEDFDRVCHLIFDRGNYVLIIDEIASYTTRFTIPFWYSELLRLGRGRNIGMISVSQRPNEIFNTIISEADIIIGFQLNLEADRKKVAGTVGDEAMKLNRIPRYHFMIYSAYEGCRWHRPV